ncbi:DUF2516 family protein [Nonomuraea sp. SYSU D8015]|uniref:DUF2516 family protein n=1 Tax=Nonomuraea sp. SYSU D8015 TaxID=2593644 RepID=UPI0016604B7F|nr:DUF2516 family protein [Nonomuraea sp. SYSU D8015]
MSLINGVFNLLFMVLAAVIFGMSVYALVHALRVPGNAFISAGKLKKELWLLILGLATLFSGAGAWMYFNAFLVALATGNTEFIGIGLGLFSILAVIAATVYIVDVKPAVKGMGGRGNSGPYGPW